MQQALLYLANRAKINTKPLLAFRDLKRKFDCNRWWRGSWDQSQGLWEALGQSLWIPRWKQQYQRGTMTHFTLPQSLYNTKIWKDSSRGGSKKCHQLQKLNLIRLLMLPTEIWLEIWLSSRKPIKFTPSPLHRGIDSPTTCLLPPKYYQHADNKALSVCVYWTIDSTF